MAQFFLHAIFFMLFLTSGLTYYALKAVSLQAVFSDNNINNKYSNKYGQIKLCIGPECRL